MSNKIVKVAIVKIKHLDFNVMAFFRENGEEFIGIPVSAYSGKIPVEKAIKLIEGNPNFQPTFVEDIAAEIEVLYEQTVH